MLSASPSSRTASAITRAMSVLARRLWHLCAERARRSRCMCSEAARGRGERAERQLAMNRQREGHCGAMARDARQLNLTVVHLHNPPADAKAESTGLRACLRREAVIEDVRDELGSNASAGVGDLDANRSGR